MNVLSIYANHDANITVRVGDDYRIYELERLMKERYFTLRTYKNYSRIYAVVCSLITKEFGHLEFDMCLCKDVPTAHMDYLMTLWNFGGFAEMQHHWEHAAGAFYLSGYEEALVFSYDDGGWDHGVATYFNVYHAKKGDIQKLQTITSCKPGGAYDLLAIPLKEVRKANTDKWGNYALSFAGKKMGLAAYGKVRKEWIEPIKAFYRRPGGHGPKFLSRLNIGIPLGVNTLEGQDSWDLAATSQYVFEETVLEAMQSFLNDFNLPVVLGGGCALNVLLNERLRPHRDVFVPPNPNDCGISFGAIVRKFPPENVPNITYKGFPLLDQDKLYGYASRYSGKSYTFKFLTDLLREGNIIGVVMGDSEVGPRALGNRSILCDPTYPKMKDVLNAKVKYREWFRPFAPVVRYEDRGLYFEFDGNSPYMSFCPKVRSGVYMPAITHVDGTARLQTVTNKQHSWLYQLLTAYHEFCGQGVLLNTSFNIKGKPLITTIEDAFSVLKNTEMDYLVVEQYLFKKQNRK